MRQSTSRPAPDDTTKTHPAANARIDRAAEASRRARADDDRRRCHGKTNPPHRDSDTRNLATRDRSSSGHPRLPLDPRFLSQSQAAGVALAAKPSLAAYGDSANIWGSTTNTSGTSTRNAESYNGDGRATVSIRPRRIESLSEPTRARANRVAARAVDGRDVAVERA